MSEKFDLVMEYFGKMAGKMMRNMAIRPVHKNLFLEFPKYPGIFMLHFDR